MPPKCALVLEFGIALGEIELIPYFRVNRYGKRNDKFSLDKNTTFNPICPDKRMYGLTSRGTQV